MIRSQSTHGRRFAQGTQSQINPFNPIQSYLIQNFNSKDYVNTIANKRISYFLDKTLNKEDEIYRQMLRNQISTGVMNDQKFASYMQKVTQAREQSEQDVMQMRIEQNKTEQMVKSAKNLKPKNAIKHVKITQEEFAINNCAQITDQEELKKQIKQLVHVNKIKNFVQRINNKKQIKYLNNVIDPFYFKILQIQNKLIYVYLNKEVLQKKNIQLSIKFYSKQQIQIYPTSQTLNFNKEFTLLIFGIKKNIPFCFLKLIINRNASIFIVIKKYNMKKFVKYFLQLDYLLTIQSLFICFIIQQALDEIKDSHKKRVKPIKYIVNENKDPRALMKPLRMPITDFKIVKTKQKPLNLSDDLTINFFDYHSKPHQIVVPKRTAEQQKIRDDEVITSLGFKIRQTSEISVVAQSRNSSPEKSSPVRTQEDIMLASRRNRNMARDRGLILDSERLEQAARDEMEREASDDMYQQKEDDNLFVTSFNPTYLKRSIASADQRTIQSSKFQQQYLNEAQSQKESRQSQINGDNVIGSQKDINLGIQLVQTQSQVYNKMIDSKGQSNKMSQLLDQMNDYQNQNLTRHMSSQINKFQSEYDKLSQQHFDKEHQQQNELEQALSNPERKSYIIKSQKAFLR